MTRLRTPTLLWTAALAAACGAPGPHQDEVAGQATVQRATVPVTGAPPGIRGAGKEKSTQVDLDKAGRVKNLSQESRQIIDAFHILYHDTQQTWRNTFWMGTHIYKNPLDMWAYQEILWDVKPDLVVECGTAAGGSSFYLAQVMELMGHGEIVTIDIEGTQEGRASFLERFPSAKYRPDHPRLTYIQGSSSDPLVLQGLRPRLEQAQRILVILDSDHSRDHVLDELRLWHSYVTPGSYLVVEDTNINGHPVFASFGPGPWEAAEIFLAENDDFVVDVEREKFLLTQNPRGFLRRK